MDNRAVLLDFKLLVDRAVDILDSLSSAERSDAVNYALSRIKQKFPESCVQVKRDHCTSRVLAVTENQNELYESLWNQQRSTTTVADLNQNFEKIMCREDFMCVDDEKYQPLSIYKCPKDEEGCDPSLVISRYADAWMTLETAASSSRSGAPQPFRSSAGVISEKLIISSPIHFKCDAKMFTFNSDKFCISFSRPDEDFNRKAFKRQFLAMLEHAVNHRKPFIRRFFNNFVLSGAIQGVRPQQIKMRISDAEDISYKNGISKISSNLAAPPCANEETNQSTTSSEDVNMTTGPPNSIVAETPKDKGEPKSARPTKDKQSYNCLLCLKTYRKRKSLIDHYKMHPGYCHDCGKPNGQTLEDVIEHNKKVHYKEFPFICDICGESYSRRQQFHAHVEAHQKKDMKSYSCGECGIEFQRKKLHRQHLDETGHKPDGAICEVCGAGFTSKNALSQHVIRVHKKDNSFECHICQNRFSLKANLERHVQLHTEIKRTYVCDQCGSSYFTYPGLREHFSNAHTDVSESKCTLCGKTFSSVKSLQRHLPSHSEERPHSCCFCMQTFKWKTHLVRHKQVVHGNQPNPKKLKRFAKCEEELVPVDIPPSAKVSRKSNSKPKQSGAKIISSPTSTMKKQKQNKIQLEAPNSFAFATENLLRQCNPQQQQQQQQPPQQQQQQQQPPTPHSAGPENNLLMNINSFNRGTETFRFDPNANYNSVQRMPLQPEQQIISTYQQGSPQHHHQQQQAQHHQQQQQHHQQQQQQPQQHHQPTPQHHHQTQHISHHAAQQTHIQPQQTHLQPPQTHIQAQQHHQQTQQSHQQAQPPHQQSHHHSPQQPQPPQQQQQPQHQQYPCASLPNDWHNLNFNAPTTAISQALDPKENKFFQVIEVNSNDFMGLPMDVKQDSVINAELLNFQNMWPPSNQQLNFNNGNVEHHNYNNIGSILTNLELIGNNTSLDFNNFEMIGSEQHAINQQQMQHNPYIHQEIDPSAGNINHNVINYDYNSQNHTITDLSNTILREQDSKNQNYQQYHQGQGSFDHSGAVYGQQATEEANKPILPPMQEYMHQPMQQAADVNIVYYPVKNEM